MAWAIAEMSYSQRRACALLGIAPKTYRYVSSRLLRSGLEGGYWWDSCQDGGDDFAQEFAQPFEDEAQVVSDGAHDGVDLVAVAFGRLLRNPLRKLQPRWPSVLQCPMTASMADRRRSSFLIWPWTPRFWPDLKTLSGLGALWP